VPVERIDAVLFGLDRVLTDAVTVHFRAWSEVLDPVSAAPSRARRRVMIIAGRQPMRTTPLQTVSLAVLTAVVLHPGAAEAHAATSNGEQFGQHVRECAQTVGFSRIHNPGLHRGFSGWDGMSCIS
jgi:hypothetical protein